MSSLPVPPFLNGHVPNGTDKAKLIDALVTFGQWVKQTTDTARQAAEAAAASVNAENIIQRTLSRIPNEIIPFKIDIVTSSRTVPVPSGAKAVKVTLRGAGSWSRDYGSNYPSPTLYIGEQRVFWFPVESGSTVNCVLGESKIDTRYTEMPNSISTVTVDNLELRVLPPLNAQYMRPATSQEYKTRPKDFEAKAIFEWYKKRPEGL